MTTAVYYWILAAVLAEADFRSSIIVRGKGFCFHKAIVLLFIILHLNNAS